MDDPIWSAEPPREQGQLLLTEPDSQHDGPLAGHDLPGEGAGRPDRDATGDSPSGTRWSLPAGPLAYVLASLRADDYMADGDVATFAQGLGLDPGLTRSVLAGEREEVSGEEVVSVCGALGCSPSDIWDGGQGGIRDVHDQGRWELGIEAPAGAADGEHHEFVRRRLDQQVRDMVSFVGAAPRPPTTGGPVRLEVTHYRQGDVLAIDATGHRHRVSDPDQPVQPGTDYHFTFRRIGETETVTAPLTAEAFAQGSPPGHGAEPRLASLAESMDPGADMVCFRDPSSGAEQWIGRETPFDDWQSWDDPRRDYPGDPAEILDDRSITDHPTLPFEPPSTEIAEPSAAEPSDALGTVDGLSIDL